MPTFNALHSGMLIVLVAVATASAARAQGSATEERLRGQLRAATVQLRNLQDQNASLQAMQAQAERERMAMAEKNAEDEKEIARLTQEARTSQSASDAAAARLKAQQDVYAKVDAQNRDTFLKLQTAYNETVQTLRTREADAARLGATLARTRGRVEACETKNSELYRLGKEILDSYANRGMLSALGGAEPFTQLKRVQYENLRQDYEDKLRANDIVHPVR